MRQVYPPGHPYVRPPRGSDAELSHLTLSDVCGFIAAHYHPDRMVVVLSGDVEPRRAIAQVASQLGRLTRGAAPPGRPVFPALTAVRRTARGMPSGLEPAVVVAWPMPPPYSRDRAVAAIALSLLRSELAQETPGAAVVELGEARASVAAAIVRLGHRARVDPDAAERALMAVRRAVRLASGDGANDRLLPLVNRRARELLSAYDALPSRVESLAAALQVGGRDQSLAEELELLDRLTPQDVSRAARNLFAGERTRVIVIEPAAAPTGPSATALRPGGGAGHDDTWTAPVDAREAVRALRVPLPRSILGAAERLRLDNGLEVILLRTGAAPLVRAQMVFGGGGADDPRGKEGLAFVAAHALDFRPRRARDPAAYEKLGSLGDELEVRVDGDSTRFTMVGLSNHLDSVLAGLAVLIEEGQYSDGLLGGLGQLSPAQATEEKLGASLFGGRRFDAMAHLRASLYRKSYGATHPHARREELWLPNARRFERSELETWRDRRFGARNGVLVIAGQFDPAIARAQAVRWFARLRPGDDHRVARAPIPRPTSHGVIVLTGDPAFTTTAIHFAYPVALDRERRAARMVLARILHERMARVRDVLGAAYSASAHYQESGGTGLFTIAALVDGPRTTEALAAIVSELARIRTGGSADLAESFVRARRAVLNLVTAEPSGAAAACRLIGAVLERGDSLAAPTRLTREIVALTVADLVPVVESDLSPAHETVGLLGAADRIAAARRAAGL